jgi:chemotaxis protein methyltransferase CheR
MVQSLLQTPQLSEAQFWSLSSMVRGLCGIHLHDGKMALVRARLNKRLRARGLNSFGQYLEALRNDDGGETAAMLDELSTNLTCFFREPRHFQYLREVALPALLRQRGGTRRLRLWSAGCSSGEEPYSIAMTVRGVLAGRGDWDAAILGTDLSLRMLQRAQDAVYSRQRLQTVPSAMVSEHFRALEGGQRYQVRPELRRLVSLAYLNLVEPWPMKGQFDVIFCRNVMIYFDKPTQAQLVERFWNQLAPGGTLFIGHSESLAGITHRFRYVQPTVYEKPW